MNKPQFVYAVGHNGPYGLGAEKYDICGVDFTAKGGDHGDIDTQ